MTETRSKMKAAFFLLSALVATSFAVPKSRNELTCSICIDIITDLDNFITSDTTEDQIVAFAKVSKNLNFYLTIGFFFFIWIRPVDCRRVRVRKGKKRRKH